MFYREKTPAQGFKLAQPFSNGATHVSGIRCALAELDVTASVAVMNSPRKPRDQPPEGELLTLRQAADSLGITPDTLRAQVHRGRLKATKLGRDWLVERSELIRYRRESKRATTGPARNRDNGSHDPVNH
jgi:excisionase family DNA binding protein